MRNFQSPAATPRVDAYWAARADGGAYGLPARVILGHVTYQGFIVHRELRAASYDEAHAMAAASSLYGLDMSNPIPLVGDLPH